MNIQAEFIKGVDGYLIIVCYVVIN